ncbi:uncharacterized protein LOC128169154 [Crassostrea angulata]|uniref:uncharacterized protein LOC128169154 n=1 Tax=Magallana angulata TaxID=2784310 RepID=UPI0022B218AE|nr:uncharacterized protein LOC128169154 [Crassostrea angulata]
MDSEQLAILNKQEEEIPGIISKIKHSIAELKKLLNSNNFSLISAYKSNIGGSRRLLPTPTYSLPTFTPPMINKEKLYQQFGSLSALSIKQKKHDYSVKSPGTDSSSHDRPLVYVPCITTDINTGYALRSVSCLSCEQLWTCGLDNIIGLYNLRGELLKSVRTTSGNAPEDITVTRNRELVYTDSKDRSVNIVNNTQIQTIIKLQGWIPRGVCTSSSGDLLVLVESDDYKHAQKTKVVRYSGSEEKQSIQFNDKGKPLYSAGGTKYISENWNLDICVSDYDARAVVVVNQAGELRFIYDGFPSNDKGSVYPRGRGNLTFSLFRPHGIATDSQSQILIADPRNNHIHILDQDGQFLRYIDAFFPEDSFRHCFNNEFPSVLCVDTRDNLFVAESKKGEIKRIKYMYYM